MKQFCDRAIHGFTLIELTFVVLIIAIVSVVAIPKWTATSFSVLFEAQHVLEDIRYAQALSMTTGFQYRWVKLSSTTYQIIDNNGNAIMLPSGTSIVTLKNNIAFGTLTNLPNNLLAFDAQGIPYTSLSNTLLATTATIPLVISGSAHTVVITPTTGYGIIQ